MDIPQHWVVTISAWLSRIVVVFVQVVSIPLLLDGLGSEFYAIFILLGALLGWYLLTDMGVGTSLQNFISEERSKEQTALKYLAHSSIVSVVLLSCFATALYLLSPILSSIYLKSFDILSNEDKRKLFFMVSILFLGTGIGNIGYKLLYALHKGYLSNALPAIASLTGLCLTWIVMDATISPVEKLLYGIIAFNFPATFMALSTFIWQILKVPRSDWGFELNVLRSLYRRSIRFWLLNLMATVVLSVDYIVLSQYVSGQEIVVYSITSRVFGFAAFFYTALYAALWPHLTEALANGNWLKIKKQFQGAFIFSIILIVALTIVLVILMPNIMALLAPNIDLAIPDRLILLFGAYHLVLAWVHGFAIVLQSISDTRTLLIWGFIQATFSLLFQLMFVQNWGIYGVVVGMIASFLLTAAWVVPKCAVRRLREICS